MTNKILKTTRYSLFTFIKGNRPINYTHVGNLVASIKEKDFAWTRFEQKLENFSSILKNQGSRHDFLVNIEKLYNHKTSVDKRIRFNLNLKA